MIIPSLAATYRITADFGAFLLIVGLVVHGSLWYKLGLWAYEDARSRNRSGGWTALLVVGTFPIGWLLWLALRPPKKPASVIIPPMRKWEPPPPQPRPNRAPNSQ